MTDPGERLRALALGLPETEEGTHFGMAAYSVRGKGFASLTKDGRRVQLHLSPEETEAALAAHPGGERLERAGRTIGLRVPLEELDDAALAALVRASWRSRGGSDDPPSDLPTGIGRPATRALHGAGLRTLAEVAGLTEAELSALHGVGPKAVRILTEALAGRGLGFRRP
ncbi:MmcQ/YjbR family DNA-binding protein [Streptomyces xanthii]|uniref:MmcQ/YjbR family DNA-binding protein n=1 Tax=Streptomyces xanthii TaxID=2768069 RepID=A0A7H1B7C2_9ACTN|nr:MmcQ/YjbR family DNA-binding protein [Streptomyces xanthii]QNS04627.1 MmcQ/YjbR family DNA-binding protein [Streptomyces xanthii]